MIQRIKHTTISLAAVLLFASGATAQLTVSAGANVFINTGATVTIAGNITNAGSITGPGTAILNGTSLQTINGIGNIDNLTLNNAAGATITTGAGNMQSLYGTLTLTNGVLATNYNLTLKSDVNGTARIATITGGGITGNVTVERWIPATGRRYRLLAPSVTTTGSVKVSIKDNWQEGQMNNAIGVNINNTPGYGTHITGAGGNANGFDVTQSNQASLYNTANALTPTYTAIANTNGALNALTGYFLFIRGDRSMNMQLSNTNVPPAPVPLPSSSTTLRATGTIQTGTINSFTNSLIGGGALNLITNPYPSPIDWSLVHAACTNITQFYTVWDASVGYRGGFVTVKTDGTLSDNTSNATKYIQPGQAFFVQSSGGVPTISIQETHKTAGNNNGIYTPPPPPQESFAVSLFYTEGSGYRRLADAVLALYDDSYSANIDGDDADEIRNWDENIAISRNNHHISIEGRPVIGVRDTLPLFMSGLKQMPYQFQFNAANFSNPALLATLVDNFTNTRTPLSVIGTTVVPFTVTSTPASYDSSRFMVVFGPASPLPVSEISLKAYQKNEGIQVEWVTRTETEMDRYEVEKSANGSIFNKSAAVLSLGNSNNPTNYGWFDANPINGFNFYRIRAVGKNGQVKYSEIVKVSISKGEGGISVYPNPAVDNKFNIYFTNMPKGTYDLNLFNSIGQLVFQSQVQHPGGSSAQTIKPANQLAAGMYDLRISRTGVKITTRIIKN